MVFREEKEMRGDEGAWIVTLLIVFFILSAGLLGVVMGLTKEINKLREEACRYNLAEWKTVDEKTGKAEFVWIINGVEVVETSTE